MRRGVNARATSLRSFVWSGRVHHDHHRDVLVGLVGDDLEHDPVARHERLVVEQPAEHVVVATQGPEVVLLVVVDGRLVSEALPDRVRIGVDHVVVGVVVDVGGRHVRGLLESSEYIVSRTAADSCLRRAAHRESCR